MMKKNKCINIYLFAVIVFLLIGLMALLTSYALWRISKEQTDSNTVEGACLDFDLQDIEENGFRIENVRPVSDEEGITNHKYGFRIINKCANPIQYQVVLDQVSVNDNEIDSNFIKLRLDDKWILRYGSLNEADDYGADNSLLTSKILYTGVLPPSIDGELSKEEHSIRLWISEDATLDMKGKEFNSSIRIITGQNINYYVTPESCFDFDSETGTINGFHRDECVTDYLVVPEKINDYYVKAIDFKTNQNTSGPEWNYVDLTKATELETIGAGAFARYIGYGQKLIIPDNVVTLGSGSFINFDGSNLKLGSSLKTIGNYAFQRYVGTGTKLVIPDSVNSIDVRAFGSFNGKGLVLGSNLTSIGSRAFSSYVGIIDVNMSKEEFEDSFKNPAIWKNRNATLNYLK